jgi:hypothetical protein
MTEPDTLFPRYRPYYIFTKRAVVAAAIVPSLKFFGVF